ncbi:MAG: response regulator [Candidatus Muirbacterium halophilum]|nr:response regulator [Candidatus Muirbacterium halophilum]MCK9474543.1 response regulator [Candidatus Muirbacterium halophilum]
MKNNSISILLIDDVADNRFLIRSFLKKINLDVVEADCGKKGLELFKENSFNLVLLDIHMPEMDGYEVAKKIREWEKLNNLPKSTIIAVTAYSWDSNIDSMQEKGFDLYISKPIERVKFLETIQQI